MITTDPKLLAKLDEEAEKCALEVAKHFHDRLPMTKFFDIPKGPFNGNSDLNTKNGFMSCASLLVPLLLEMKAALEFIKALDANPFNHHKDPAQCSICKAKEALKAYDEFVEGVKDER